MFHFTLRLTGNLIFFRVISMMLELADFQLLWTIKSEIYLRPDDQMLSLLLQ